MSSELRFGFSTNAFREYDLDEAIGVIADAGYDGVELLFDEPHLYPTTATDADVESVQAALDEHGIAVSNCNAFMLTAIEGFHHPSYVEPDDDYRRRRIDYTADALRVAAALGQEYVSIEPGGPVPEGRSREWAMDRFVAALEELTPVARETGVDLLVEPEPDLLIETTDQFLALADRVDTDVVGCNFDAGHLFCVGEDPAAQVDRLAPYTQHYHLEDIPADRSHEHTQLGDGAMDVDAFLAAVADTDYDGYVTVELYPYQATAAETAREAMAYLRENGWA
jgi:sugar phosphate isomerase/epimerase